MNAIPDLRFSLSYSAKNLDDIVAKMCDLRQMATILPFRSVSKLHLRGGVPREVGFDVDPGYDCEWISFYMIDGDMWSGSGSFRLGHALKTHSLAAFLHVQISAINMLDYAEILGFRAQVEDPTNYWNDRSLPALVRAIPDVDKHLNGLGTRLRAYLLGEPVPFSLDDDDYENRLLESITRLLIIKQPEDVL
jgi:hypothetical protein